MKEKLQALVHAQFTGITKQSNAAQGGNAGVALGEPPKKKAVSREEVAVTGHGVGGQI